MQSQSKSWPIAVAIVIAAAMICGTLIVVNMRVTYPMVNGNVVMDGNVYTRLLSSGCTVITSPSGGQFGVSCPLWIRP
jgi:hypothetical protein